MSTIPLIQASQRPFKGIYNGVALQPKAFQPQLDLVRFGKSGLNLTAAKQKTEAEAHTLFSHYTTPETLLAAVKTKFETEPCADGKIHPLQVFQDASSQAACNQLGPQNHAFFYWPDTLQYGRCQAPHPTSSDDPPALTKHFKRLNRLELDQQFGIFINPTGSSADLMIVLKHELFHALQFKNGLPFGTTLAADNAASVFKDSAHDVSGKGIWEQLHTMAKLTMLWSVDIPLILLKRLFTKGFKDTPATQPTAGKALRLKMAREMELDHFMITDPSSSLQCRTLHLMHFTFESAMQWCRSWALP